MIDVGTDHNEPEKVREFPFHEKDFLILADLIHQRTGIVLKRHKMNMVYSRLARRLRVLGIRSFADYLAFLTGQKGDEEISALINAITTNLTRFFREEHHFDHFYSVACEEIITGLKHHRAKRLRIWSAGCSSGEEAYSIAMVLQRALKKHDMQDIDAKILATDLDTNMLETGRKGRYKAEVLELVKPQYRHWLKPNEDRPYEILADRKLRQMISFKSLNLLGEWPMKGPFDVIFCRNVMIYFDQDAKNELARRFSEMLREGGWLYIGHSERIPDKENGLRLFGRTIYQKSTHRTQGGGHA